MIMATMLNLWTLRLTTFLLWALAAGSAAFWILQGVNAAPSDSAAPLTKPALTTNHTPAASNVPQIATLLGAKNPVIPTAASAAAASQARFQLVGVLAVSSKKGAALLAIDGKPAKPYRLGALIEDGLEVTAVAARSVSIGRNGTTAFTLELPLQK
jgi:general secretion pathway protein C